jgi:chemotaxis-related protein WspB
MERDEGTLRRLALLEREVARLRSELFPERALEELPETLEALVAVVAGAAIALPLDAVLEVIPRVPIRPLPDAPAHALGHIRWRGVHVAVFDLTCLWTGANLSPRRLEDRLVVVRHEGVPRGLLVPDVEGVESFGRHEWNPVAADAGGAEYAVALAHRPQGSVLLVSLPRLFAAAPLSGSAEPDAAEAEPPT